MQLNQYEDSGGTIYISAISTAWWYQSDMGVDRTSIPTAEILRICIGDLSSAMPFAWIKADYTNVKIAEKACSRMKALNELVAF